MDSLNLALTKNAGSYGTILFLEHIFFTKQLLEQADNALYCTKNLGRNRVEFFQTKLN